MVYVGKKCVLDLLVMVALTMGIQVANAAPTGRVPDDVHDFYQQDIVLHNACKPSELGRLKRKVYALSKGKEPAEAWSLIHAMLCGDDVAARRYVVAHTAKLVRIVDRSGGEEVEGEALPGADIQLVGMQAWSTGVTLEAGGVIRVDYGDGGVCMYDFDLESVHHTWRLTSMGSGCD